MADGGSGATVLHDVSFTIEPGERVVILGATGSGKTSVVNCIPRFYDVTEGAVRIDGVDVRDASIDAVRSTVAVALQQANVFTGSIRRNIAMGNPAATESDIISCLLYTSPSPRDQRGSRMPSSA